MRKGLKWIAMLTAAVLAYPGLALAFAGNPAAGVLHEGSAAGWDSGQYEGMTLEEA